MTKLSDITGISPTTRTFLPSDDFVSPACVVGMEVEVEMGRNRAPTPHEEYWSLTDDGSLRNNGIEYVSKPLFGKDIIKALDNLTEILPGSGYTISERCGFHVHIDVSEMTTSQLLSFCCGYALIESAIYNYVGNDRRENIYCLPLSATGNIIPFLNSIKYGRNNTEIRTSIEQTCKYSGFNILPVLYQGSVEFRHHRGTISKEAIIRWINIIMRIREAAFRREATALTNSTYEEVRQILLGTDASTISYSRQDWLSGYITAKDILNFNKLEDSWNEIQDFYGAVGHINLNLTSDLEDI